MCNDEFKILTTRGSGPGGQHKNKTESCVVVIHNETGLKETCQETRSQLKNKQIALERLKKRIELISENEVNKIINDMRNKILNNPIRIRTYNYKTGLAINHITGKKFPLDRILNGELNLLYG